MYSLFGVGSIGGSLFESYHLVHEDQKSSHKIFLGNFLAAMDEKFHEEKKVKFVLTVASGLHISVKDKNIEHKIIDAYDLPTFNLGKFFDETFTWIDERIQRGNILVHCAAGVSRSSSIVIAYLIRKYGWDYEKAHDYVKEKRKFICPNDGFCKQLKDYEKKHKK